MSERKTKSSLFETLHGKERGQPTRLHKREYYPATAGEAAHFTSNLVSDILPVAEVVQVSDAKTKEEMYLSEGGVHKPANETKLQAAILIIRYIFADGEHSFTRAGKSHNVAWNNNAKTGYLYDLENTAEFFRLPEHTQIRAYELSMEVREEVAQKLVALKLKLEGAAGLKTITDSLGGKKITDVMNLDDAGLLAGVTIPQDLTDDEWIQRYQDVLLRRIQENLSRVREAQEEENAS